MILTFIAKFEVPQTQNANDAPTQGNNEEDQQPQVDLQVERNNNADIQPDNIQADIPATQSNPLVNQNTQVNADNRPKFDIRNIKRGKFQNGRRYLRVEWQDGSRSWEPDSSFDPDMLEEINYMYTKMGKRRKTFFTRRKN